LIDEPDAPNEVVDLNESDKELNKAMDDGLMCET
jgi:hypothetical protein